MDDTRRQALLTQLELAIAAAARAVDRLAPVVGDAQVVPDENGWLPAERRDLAVTICAAERVTEVRELRDRVSFLQEELTSAKGRPERARIRESLRKDSAWLAFLEAMPSAEAPTMCSECASPAALAFRDCHLQRRRKHRRPWPSLAAVETADREGPPRVPGTFCAQGELPAAKPQPIAVIGSGEPIEKVIARLTAV